MANNSQQLVQKLWRYCNVLRDDGLSFPAYVEQLTYLLFLKMAHEQRGISPKRTSIIPDEYDWHSLVSRDRADPRELHSHYGAILKKLSGGEGMLGIIFHEAKNRIQDPAKLRLLVVDLIDKENWSALDTDVKGDAYEGLLEKNAQDTKSGAGQYFTPRPLIKAVVECVRPQLGETIYDPACGTCGFLLAAHDYIVEHNPRMSQRERKHLRLKALRGVELVGEVTRLGAMNLLLHGIGPADDEEGAAPIKTDDSLGKPASELYNVVLTNPPFGKKSSVTMISELGERERQPLTIVRPDFITSTSNKQLNFLQHIYTALEMNGRAAVVVPDNVLFEGGAGEIIRRRFLQEFDVHTLLRLPPGIFYAHGIKTNVLFFDRKEPNSKPATDKLWIYDLRTNTHFTLRTKRLERTDLEEFVVCFSSDNRQKRQPTWTPQTPLGRWRDYSYEELIQRDRCSLDIFWLREDDLNNSNNTATLNELATEIMDDLQAALYQIQEIASDLGDT
jgi:type I restriction enzyme M protein